MGWKNVKEHYRIAHSVTIKDEWDDFSRKPTGHKLLCIGSQYCHDLITVNLTTWKFGKALSGPLRNEDLQRYWDEMHADLDKIRALVEQPDTFEKSIVVYTYDGGDIVEKFCEEPGWPNVTHDGLMQYENTFSTDREYIIERARSNAEAKVECGLRNLEEAERRLSDSTAFLEQARADLEKLNRL